MVVIKMDEVWTNRIMRVRVQLLVHGLESVVAGMGHQGLKG